jgi:hypothetical protein
LLLATLVWLCVGPARANGSSADLDVEISDANRLVNSGQVSLGMEQIKEIFSKIDPNVDFRRDLTRDFH